MDLSLQTRKSDTEWWIEPHGRMRVPGIIRSPSPRGVAEEAPGAYKDVAAVVDAADHAGLSKKVARLEPLVCVKG